MVTREAYDELKANFDRLLRLVLTGLHCEFDDRMAQLRINDEADPSVGDIGSALWLEVEGYTLVPDALWALITKHGKEDAFEKVLDIYQQTAKVGFYQQKSKVAPE